MTVPIGTVEIDRVALRPELITVARRLLPQEYAGLAGTLEWESRLSHISEDLILYLRAYLMRSEHVRDYRKESIEVPATWWQHFKQDCLPEWFKRKYPVKNRRIEVEYPTEIVRLCPHSDVQWPDRKHIDFVMARDCEERSTLPR